MNVFFIGKSIKKDLLDLMVSVSLFPFSHNTFSQEAFVYGTFTIFPKEKLHLLPTFPEEVIGHIRPTNG